MSMMKADTFNDLDGVDPFDLNAYSDALDWVGVIGRDLVDADMIQSDEHGLDLMTGGRVYIETYEGTNGFVRNLKKALARNKVLTHRQIRAALNVMRREYGGLPRSNNGTEADLARKSPCYLCHEVFDTFDELQQHKEEAHGPGWLARQQAEERAAKEAVIPDLGLRAPEKDVIADTTATRGLNLANLPDGRYAVPNTTGNGKDAFIYLRVARVKRTTVRDRRYRYGKMVTGEEVVLAGTIEVRRYISDTQELVGQQKPGDVYRGDNEADLDIILMSPEAMAKMFGIQMGHCCICGKKLTDDISQVIGMGLECEKKEAYFSNPKKWVKHYEADCVVCNDLEAHDETFHKPGAQPRFEGFDYRLKETHYSCPIGHRWSVTDKAVVNVQVPADWKPTEEAQP